MKLRFLPEWNRILNLRNFLIILIVGGGFYCYSGVFLSLMKQWRSNEIYSHGFLIPLISLYLFHFKRDSIAEIPIAPSYAAGVPALAIALFCLLAGRIAGILVLEEISIVLSISAALLLLFGRRLLRVVWLPVLYLLLMIPMWDIFTDRIQLPFQLLSSTIGVDLLNRIGIPIHQNGIFIELPGITLEVAKACSGVNYLISILAIGIPLSYINTRRYFRRFLILFSSIVIALLSNGIRVFLVGLFVYKGILGKDHDIHGPFHILQALSVSFVGYIVVFLLVWLLKDDTPQDRLTRKISLPSVGRIFDHLHAGPLAICAMLLISYAGLLGYYKPIPSPLKKGFEKFPYSIGDWKGINEEFPLNIYGKKKADLELFRKYQSVFPYPVRLYVGYFEIQAQGKELIDYKIGDFFDGNRSTEVKLASGKRIRVNRLVERRSDLDTVYHYWVQVDGNLLLNKYAEKYFTLRNALVHRRTNGAIVITSMDIPIGEKIDLAMEVQVDFIRRAYPILNEYIF